MKKVAILGSTGSIGTQTLDIIRANSDKLSVYSLVANSNTKKLAEQCAEFAPKYSALISREGENCIVKAVQGADIAVVATRGIVALESILYCLDNGIDVALANKETLVCAGELVRSKAGASGLYPIDSEHCAVKQCLLGHDRTKIDKILLTASGGPFWNLSESQLQNVTAKEALQHPNWNMGAKITVDSATMMNKSLEVVEASFLFGLPVEKIQIAVHRQSIVHSMVQFVNGEVVAQLASPDMRLPIQIALLGDDGNFACSKLNFSDSLNLGFEACNFDKFPCARLGYEIMQYHPLARTVMNAANDVCVERFLDGKFSFTDFYSIIVNAVEHFHKHFERADFNLINIKKFDTETKLFVNKLLDGDIC